MNGRRGFRWGGPRAVAALIFAAAGLVIPVAWYGPVVVHGAAVSWVLFFVVPALAAACVGAAGAPILSAPRCPSGGAAALRGAGLALVAFALFAFMFAAGIKLTEPGWSSVVGLAIFTLTLGLIAAGSSVAGLGALAGWIVWRVSRSRAGTREPVEPVEPVAPRD